jgi:hypothetical protein
MQFKKISLLVVATLFFLHLAANLTAQVLRENEKGEKIIVYPDGRWQYFADYTQGSTVKYDPEESQSDNSDKYPVFEGKIAPLEGDIPITMEDLRKIADRRKQLATSAADLATQRATEAADQVVYLERELTAARKKQDQETMRRLEIRLDAARRTQRETELEARSARRELDQAVALTEKGNFAEEYLKNQEKLRQRLTKRNATSSRSALNLSAFKEPYGDMPTPPAKAKNCDYAFEGKDQRTGATRIDLQQELLFTHTNDRLRLFLKDKEYMRCEGYFTTTGGFYFLTFEFTFAYPNAREAYGFIEKGSILTVKLLNGDFINIQAGKMDRGSYDTETELLTYRVHYPISYGQINVLKNSEVDTIRVFWSSGFEEYPVYRTDFFLQQIRCLESL